MTGGTTTASSESKTAWRLSGGVIEVYGASSAGSATAGSSQSLFRRVLTVMSDDDRYCSHLADSTGWAVEADATPAFEKKCEAFWVLPGSTTMSHLLLMSSRLLNCQMPLCHMAIFPCWNRTSSPMPPICASVGIVVPTFSTRWVAAATPASLL